MSNVEFEGEYVKPQPGQHVNVVRGTGSKGSQIVVLVISVISLIATLAYTYKEYKQRASLQDIRGLTPEQLMYTPQSLPTLPK